MGSGPGELSLYLTFVRGEFFLEKLDAISPDSVSKYSVMPWCTDFTVDEGGRAEPTRDKTS